MAKTVILKLDQVKCTNENHCLDMTSGSFIGSLDFTTATPQVSGVNVATTADVAQAKNELLGGAGAAYDTLRELETALTTSIGTKLGKTEKAADSNKLDGLDSTAFLRSTAKAADSAKLNGQAASYYATASALSGKLGTTQKAADSEKLDGLDSSAFARTTGLATTTDGSTALGWTGTQFKAVPVGVSVITKRTGSDGAIEFVLPTA